MAGLTVHPDFGYVIMVAAAIGLQIPLIGGIYVGAARRAAFGKGSGFIEKATKAGLPEEHKKAKGTDRLPSGGYPDMGNG